MGPAISRKVDEGFIYILTTRRSTDVKIGLSTYHPSAHRIHNIKTKLNDKSIQLYECHYTDRVSSVEHRLHQWARWFQSEHATETTLYSGEWFSVPPGKALKWLMDLVNAERDSQADLQDAYRQLAETFS